MLTTTWPWSVSGDSGTGFRSSCPAASSDEWRSLERWRAIRGFCWDEPTGNLDSGSAQQMFELLAGLHRSGTTVVYVTHDLNLAALASRMVTVRDGLIVADTAVVS